MAAVELVSSTVNRGSFLTEGVATTSVSVTAFSYSPFQMELNI